MYKYNVCMCSCVHVVMYNKVNMSCTFDVCVFIMKGHNIIITLFVCTTCTCSSTYMYVHVCHENTHHSPQLIIVHMHVHVWSQNCILVHVLNFIPVHACTCVRLMRSLSTCSHPLESTAVADQTSSSGIGSSPALSPSQSNYDVHKNGLHKLV